jgi:hypothetical protein
MFAPQLMAPNGFNSDQVSEARPSPTAFGLIHFFIGSLAHWFILESRDTMNESINNTHEPSLTLGLADTRRL